MLAKRRFTLSDAMILIATVAVGLAWIVYERTNWFSYRFDDAYDPRSDTYPIPRSWRPAWYYVSRSWRWFKSFLPLLAVMTVAIIPLSLSQPRPKLSRVLRQSGLCGSVAATIALLSCGFGNAFRICLDHFFYHLENPGKPDPYPEHFWPNLSDFIVPEYVGIAVLGAWVAGVMGGRRRRADWVDGLGRGLCWVWLAMVPIEWASRWL